MRDDETSADWDEAMLQEVVEKKHGKEKTHPTTDIVSWRCYRERSISQMIGDEVYVCKDGLKEKD